MELSDWHGMYLKDPKRAGPGYVGDVGRYLRSVVVVPSEPEPRREPLWRLH